MVCGYNGPRVQHNFGGEFIANKESIKILGVHFQSNLKWSTHVNKVIKKVNSLSYSLKVLNCVLSIENNTKTLSTRMSKGNCLSTCLSGVEMFPIMITEDSTLLFKIIRLHCCDFSNILTNRQLCENADVRSLTSLRVLADCYMLYKLISYSHEHRDYIEINSAEYLLPRLLLFNAPFLINIWKWKKLEILLEK